MCSYCQIQVSAPILPASLLRRVPVGNRSFWCCITVQNIHCHYSVFSHLVMSLNEFSETFLNA
uniref:Uncharacterized protein n=1 Tax=Anguilla anguilla TaxID=7936 RepID=A0A0E9XJ46_ANGAN